MANESEFHKTRNSISESNSDLPKVLFIHSNPLVEGVPLLDYLEEEAIIKKCCIDSKLAIRFSSEVGTVKALSSSLIHGANIIHYSGMIQIFTYSAVYNLNYRSWGS
jgi:hypothetical protein